MNDPYDMEDFERLLMFFYVLKHGCKDQEDQIKKFRQISGMNKHDTQLAIDQCVLRGFIDK